MEREPMRPLDRLKWLADIGADRGLPPLALHVASALAQYVDSQAGNARPGIDTLAADTGLHRGTVVKLLAALHRAGWLGKRVGGGRGRATEWTPQTVVCTATESEPETDTQAATVSSPETVANTVAETVVETVAPPAPPSGDQGRTGDPSPPKSPARKRSAKSSTDPPADLPKWIPIESWMAWERHRREIGHRLTDSTRRAQWRKLDGYREDGHRPEDVIEHSIAGGWQGLFPDRGNGRYETPHERIARLNRVEPEAEAERAELREAIDGDCEILDATGERLRG